jgi:hypothetical protein
VKKHDLAEIFTVNEEEDVKNIDIQLLINQIDRAIETSDVELEELESEVGFLKEINQIIQEFQSAVLVLVLFIDEIK